MDSGRRRAAPEPARDPISVIARVQAALLLTFTTPFHDLVDALRQLRLPRIMVAIISFM
jgi:energy-coupling factor transporter transmembrane protein EcfT